MGATSITGQNIRDFSVEYTDIQKTSLGSILLGRSSSTPGILQEILIGNNLILDEASGTLSAIGVISAITGTPSRIIITGTATNPIIDISSVYSGQTSINTLGTITGGTWQADVINYAYLGTGGGGTTKFLREDNTWQIVSTPNLDQVLTVGNTSTNGMTIGNLSVSSGVTLNGITTIGSTTNNAYFTASGQLSFTGTGDYLVLANRYAFRYATSPTTPSLYGMFFNSSTANIEVRNSSGVMVFGMNANDGHIIAQGTSTLVNATLSGTLGVSSAVTLTSITDAVGDFLTRDSVSGLITRRTAAETLSDIGAVSLSGSYADPAWLTSLAWSKITTTPTTLSGYGITDAASDSNVVHLSGAETITGVKTFSGTNLYVNNGITGSGSTGNLFLGDGVISKSYGTGFTINSSLKIAGFLQFNSVPDGAGNFLTFSGGNVTSRTPAETLADLGISTSSFIKNSNVVNGDLNTLSNTVADSQFFVSDLNPANAPSAASVRWNVIQYYQANQYGFQLAASAYNSSYYQLYFRRGITGTWQSTWDKIYTDKSFIAGTDYLTPTGSAASLTNFPILNQNTTGNAATVTNGVYLSTQQTVTSKHLKNSYIAIGGEYGDLGMTGLYDRNELTLIDKRGTVTYSINVGTVGNLSKLFDGSGDFAFVSGFDATTVFVLNIDMGANVSNYSHAYWQPFVANRLTSGTDQFKNITVEVSADNVTWYSPTTGWSYDSTIQTQFPAGIWMGTESYPGISTWRYARFTFSNPVGPDAVYISEVGIRHISAPYARQYIRAAGDYMYGNLYFNNNSTTNVTINSSNGNVTATSFIKSGGTSSQFLKADGSVDTSAYSVDSNVVHISGTETITGAKSFSSELIVNNIISSGKVGGNGELRSYQDTSFLSLKTDNTSHKSGIFRSNTDFILFYDTTFGSTNIVSTVSGQPITFGGRDQGTGIYTEWGRFKWGGNFGIGTTTPYSLLNVVFNSVPIDIRTRGILSEYYGNGNYGGKGGVSMVAGGTKSSPTIVSVNDIASTLQPLFYDGTIWRVGARIDVKVSSVSANTSVGTDLVFHTGIATGDASLGQFTGITERMKITSSGNVGINNSTPNYTLDVIGNIQGSSFIVSGGTSSQFLKADGSVDSNVYINTTGTYSDPTWLTSLAWSKITSTPTTLSGYSITTSDPLLLNKSDYLFGYYNYTNGYLIKTNIPSTTNIMIELNIEGNSYGGVPIFSRLNVYSYQTPSGYFASPALIHFGVGNDIDVFYYGGYVCFWTTENRIFNTLRFTLKTSIGGSETSYNITSITNEAEPATGITQLITVSGFKGWNSANDGSGSGLDADLLDGHDSSYFLAASSGSSTYVPYTGASTNVDLGIHNLTVDTNSLFVDSINHRVGIGTTSPNNPLQVIKASTNNNGASNYGITVSNTQGSNDGLGIGDFTTYKAIQSFGSTPLSLNPTGNNIGIGIVIPAYAKLQINSAALGSNALLSLSTIDGTYNPRIIISHVTSTTSQYVKFDSSYSSGTGYSNWVFNSGNVGIGTITPTSDLHVVGTDIATSGYSNFLVNISNTVSPTSDSSGSHYALNFDSNWTSANNSTGKIVGVTGAGRNSGTGTVSNAIGVDGTAGNYNASGTTTTAISFNAFGYKYAGNITNWRGLNIQTPSGPGTLVNAYGIYIENQNAAITNNYSIYSVGGTNYFGGNIGVGTTSPLQQLDVSKQVSGGVGGIMQISNTIASAIGNAVELRFAPSPSALTRYSSIQAINVDGNNNIDLVFIIGAGSNISERFRIAANGTITATNSNITANSFIKSGGTSSQFLKADGSVDSSTYLTTAVAASTYSPIAGSSSIVTVGTLSSGSIPYSLLTGTVPTWNQNTTGNAATVTNGLYSTGSYANPAWLTSLAWSKITSTPTTLAGYGITDAVDITSNQIISGTKTFSLPPIIQAGSANGSTNNLPLDVSTQSGIPFVRFRNNNSPSFPVGNIDIYYGGSASTIANLGGSGFQINAYTGSILLRIAGTTYATVDNSGLTVTGSIIKSGGTSSQFLKADGSVDSNVYINTTGTYSDPTWLTSLAWSKITGEPTTLAGYGITDAQTKLNGTGFVKVAGTTVSYDNSTYLTTASAAATYAPKVSPTFTGTVTLPSTTSIGTVTSTEIGYLDGVTSSIQTQLNNAFSFENTIPGSADLNTYTTTGFYYQVSDADAGTGTNYPPIAKAGKLEVFGFGGSFVFQYYHVYSPFQTTYFRQCTSSIWTSWRETLDSTNYTSYAPTKTGTGASGTWGINITGNASTVGGLPVASGVNNVANQIVRTDGSGYLQTGWINTVSGVASGTLTRVYCSQDAYLRYLSPSAFATSAGLVTISGNEQITGAKSLYNAGGYTLNIQSGGSGTYGRLAFNANGYSQNGSAIEGTGNSTGVDCGDLRFYTMFGGTLTEKMRLTGMGNLFLGYTATQMSGINTGWGTYVLDVNGTSRFTGAMSSTSTITSTSSITGAYLGISNTTGTNGYGLSLYGGATAGAPSYGIMFQGTATYGTFGGVTGDWATYFTMSGANTRGWVFKAGNSAGGNVASISATGVATFSGSCTAPAFFQSSDIRLKEIVKHELNSFDISLIKYYLKSDLNKKQRWGYSAQEVEKEIPEAVTLNANGYRELDYSQVHSVKIQQLENKIKELEFLIKKLTK